MVWEGKIAHVLRSRSLRNMTSQLWIYFDGSPDSAAAVVVVKRHLGNAIIESLLCTAVCDSALAY